MGFQLQTQEFRGFKGLNDSRNPFLLQPTEASDCSNVRYDDGAITKIAGAAVHGSDITATCHETWGMYDFVKRDGTRRFVRVARTAAANPIVGTSLYWDNAGTWTVVGAGADFHASLHTFVTWPLTDLLFLANKGGSVMSKYNGTSLSAWGLPVPGVAPSTARHHDGDITTDTAANNGLATAPDLDGVASAVLPVPGVAPSTARQDDGNIATDTLPNDGTATAPDLDGVAGGSLLLGGTFSVKYTYYNTTTGEESVPTSATAIVLGAAEGTIRVEIQRDPWWTDDTNFDSIRIYRTAPSGSDYFLDKTVDANNIKGAGETIADAACANRQVDLDGAVAATEPLLKSYGVSYTYYNSLTGEESNPTDTATLTFAVGEKTIRVELQRDPWWVDDTNFDSIRVYRTTGQSTVALAATAQQYLDRTIDANNIKGGAEDINDAACANRQIDLTQTDVALTAAGTLRETDNDRPPALKYIVQHQGRIFGAGNATNPHQLFYSKLEEPENWPGLNFINIYNPATGGRVDIIGLLPYQDQLWIFTRDQVAILRGTTNADFVLQWLPHGIGCVSHHTIAAFGNVIAWWSEMGPVAWDGGQFVLLGLGERPRIQTLIDTGIASARLDDMVAALWKIGGRVQYIVAYTPTGGSAHTRLLVYDKLQDAFSIRNYGVNCTSLAVVEDSNDLDRIFLGTDSLDVLQLDQGNAIDGGAISAYHDTSWFDAGQPSARKKLAGLNFWVKPETTAGWKITVSWYFDFSTTAAGSKTITVPATRARPIHLPLRGKFQAVRYRFANANANEPFSIDSYEVLYRRQTALREVAA